MKIAAALAVLLLADCAQEPAPLSLPVAEFPDDASLFAPIRKAGWSQLRLGMPDDAALALVGSPDSVHTTVESGGRHEQSVYGKYYPYYLYFDNGRLVTILD